MNVQTQVISEEQVGDVRCALCPDNVAVGRIMAHRGESYASIDGVPACDTCIEDLKNDKRRMADCQSEERLMAKFAHAHAAPLTPGQRRSAEEHVVAASAGARADMECHTDRLGQHGEQ